MKKKEILCFSYVAEGLPRAWLSEIMCLLLTMLAFTKSEEQYLEAIYFVLLRHNVITNRKMWWHVMNSLFQEQLYLFASRYCGNYTLYKLPE